MKIDSWRLVSVGRIRCPRRQSFETPIVSPYVWIGIHFGTLGPPEISQRGTETLRGEAIGFLSGKHNQDLALLSVSVPPCENGFGSGC